jgi:peptidoglycan/xylan/chitin deacetylase (PgdA/CDA1 family)
VKIRRGWRASARLASAALIWAGTAAVAAAAPRVAFTFDDGPRLAETPLLTPLDRNEAILEALRDTKVRAALFVTVANGADRPAGRELLDAWAREGHFIANHSVSHPDFNKPEATLEVFRAEVMGCDEVIRSRTGYRKWFRFPYLREGKPEERRLAFAGFLAEQGYRVGHVTLDTSDWRIDEALRKALGDNALTDLGPFRRAYLDHLHQRAEAYRALSKRLFERDVDQVILLHHNLINALFLEDAIAQFRAEGWEIIDPETAFRDPVYREEPKDRVAGQSLLVSLARTKFGKELPELVELFDDGDRAIEELEKVRESPSPAATPPAPLPSPPSGSGSRGSD